MFNLINEYLGDNKGPYMTYEEMQRKNEIEDSNYNYISID